MGRKIAVAVVLIAVFFVVPLLGFVFSGNRISACDIIIYYADGQRRLADIMASELKYYAGNNVTVCAAKASLDKHYVLPDIMLKPAIAKQLRLPVVEKSGGGLVHVDYRVSAAIASSIASKFGLRGPVFRDHATVVVYVPPGTRKIVFGNLTGTSLEDYIRRQLEPIIAESIDLVEINTGTLPGVSRYPAIVVYSSRPLPYDIGKRISQERPVYLLDSDRVTGVVGRAIVVPRSEVPEILLRQPVYGNHSATRVVVVGELTCPFTIRYWNSTVRPLLERLAASGKIGLSFVPYVVHRTPEILRVHYSALTRLSGASELDIGLLNKVFGEELRATSLDDAAKIAQRIVGTRYDNSTEALLSDLMSAANKVGIYGVPATIIVPSRGKWAYVILGAQPRTFIESVLLPILNQ